MSISTSGFHNVQSVRVSPVTSIKDGLGGSFESQTIVVFMADGSHHAISLFLTPDGSGITALPEEFMQVEPEREFTLNSGAQ